MGPSEKPPNLAPFFWPRPHCPQLGFGSALGGYHNQGQTPPRRSSIRLSQFIPAVLKETKERECSVVSYRPFFKKKPTTQIPPFITSGSYGVPTNGTGGYFSRPKFGGKTRMAGSFDFGTFSTLLELVIISKIKYPPNTGV